MPDLIDLAAIFLSAFLGMFLALFLLARYLRWRFLDTYWPMIEDRAAQLQAEQSEVELDQEFEQREYADVGNYLSLVGEEVVDTAVDYADDPMTVAGWLRLTADEIEAEMARDADE